MGFKKNLNIFDISNQISSAARECASPVNDGYTAFYIKQDLYQIKWFLDAAIKSCPRFEGEEQWIKEQEQKKIFNILQS